MPIERIVLVGAGGHSTVVLDALARARGSLDNVVLADAERHGQVIMGCNVIAPNEFDFTSASFHVSIGDNATRQRLQAEIEQAGGRPATIIHPAAVVSDHAELAPGVFVAAGAVVGPLARIGDGTIVNHNAVVDHECTVGAFSHVAPGASLAGRVTVGNGVLVGTGARLLPGVGVGADATIGAGAVIRKDIPAGMVYAGARARRIK